MRQHRPSSLGHSAVLAHGAGVYAAARRMVPGIALAV